MTATTVLDAPRAKPVWLVSDQTDDELRIALAREASMAWAKLSVSERAHRLRPAVTWLMEHAERCADVICAENGKPRVEALGHEVGASIGALTWLCDNAPRVLAPRSITPGWLLYRTAEIRRRPHGVVLVISPWNFPLSIPLGQVATALVSGNAVVLKPSEVTPRCADLVAEAFAACDLPHNLLTIVHGDGQVGAALIDARPDKVLFTGSVATGRRVMAAAARHPIPVTLELGGVDAMIVCEDADIEYASSAACWGATFNGGQVCASVERLIVHDAVYEPFIAALVRKMGQLDPNRESGRTTLDRQAAVYDAHVADAQARGLTLRCGGVSLGDRYTPTVIDGDGVEASTVWREESFGPIVAVARFRQDEEAVAMHDASPFGLTASVFSRSRSRARHMAEQLTAGVVSINDVAASLHAFAEIPWGGVGDSGFGRSHGAEGLLACTWVQVIEQTRAGVFEFKRPWWYPYTAPQQSLIDNFSQLVGERSALAKARRLGRLGRQAVALLTRHPRL